MVAEQALVESEQRFRALVTASADIVYRMSADFKELLELEGRLFIAPSSTSPNLSWMEEYIYPDDRQSVRDAVREAVEHKSKFEIECRGSSRTEPSAGPSRGRSRCSTPTATSSSGSAWRAT